jgi:hypothetical protein
MRETFVTMVVLAVVLADGSNGACLFGGTESLTGGAKLSGMNY